MSYLYILEINPCWSLCKCLLFCGLSSFLLTVSFAVQKVLSLTRSHLFIFVFMFIILGGGSNRISL